MPDKQTLIKWGLVAALALLLLALVAAIAAPLLLPIFTSYLSGEKPSFAHLLPMLTSQDPFAAWQSYLVEQSSQDYFFAGMAMIIALLAFFAGAFLLYAKTQSSSRKVDNGVLGGQKAIASKAQILRECPAWDGKSEPVDGVVVGSVRNKAVLLPCNHAAINAPSGSFKTRGSVYGTADALSFTGKNNLVFTDPSMEIYCVASPCLKARGYSIQLLDLENPRQGSRWNPLELIHYTYWDRQDLARAESLAREIGSTLFPAPGGDNDVFINGAAGLFSAVAFKVATSPEIPDESRHLWSVVCTIVEGTSGGAEPLKRWLAQEGNRTPQAIMAKIFLDATGKFEASILGELHNGLQYLTSANARWLTSASDLRISQLGQQQTAVFIHTMGPGNPANKLASLFFSQLWAETQSQGRYRTLRPCWVIGDEWHAVPRFDLVTAVEQGRKYGLHFIMYTQSFSGYDQYRTNKEDGKDAILANCDVKALFKAGSDQDARYFETLSGFKTIRTESTGRTSSGSWTKSSSTSYSEQKVPVWPMGDILARNPQKDGALVIRNAGNGYDSAKLEVPLVDASKTFTAAHFGTLGTPEYERQVIAVTLSGLERRAAAIPIEVDAWFPDFQSPTEDAPATIADDEWAAWD